MLKGLALTPPVIGRISIGRVVEKNGRRLPEKDDEFTLTSQVQHLGQWVAHPLDAKLRSSHTRWDSRLGVPVSGWLQFGSGWRLQALWAFACSGGVPDSG